MAVFFDPTLPADHSEVASHELRDQFNSLNDQDTDLGNLITDRANKPLGVTALTQGISDPPAAAEVQAIQDKLNELIAALKT